MRKTRNQVRIIPVAKDSEVKWLIGKVKEELAAIIPELDKAGKNYDHDVPWHDRFLLDAKAYLKRVKIGAIGRINTCEDAIKLGVMNKIPADSSHFTSMGLYFVFRIARQKRREVVYIKDLEKWLTTLRDNPKSPHMFTNYSQTGYYG